MIFLTVWRLETDLAFVSASKKNIFNLFINKKASKIQYEVQGRLNSIVGPWAKNNFLNLTLHKRKKLGLTTINF